MVRLSSQNSAAQWGKGRMHELTSVLRAVGHCSRLPSLVFDLHVVSRGAER